MFVITVNFECHAEQRDAFEAALKTQAGNSLSREPECHVFDVCHDPAQPTRFFLYEVYSDAAAFDLHLASDHFLDFDKKVSDMVVSKSVGRWDRLPANAE